MLTDWRARHLHPWLNTLHLVMNGTHDGCDIASTIIWCITITIGRAWPSIRITDVIKVDTIDIILPHNLSTDTRQVRSDRRVGRVEIRTRSVVSDSEALLFQRSTSQRVLCTYGNRCYPSMEFHTTFVTFRHGKGKRVITITWCPTLNACNTPIPWFDIRRINRCCTHTCL